MNTRCKKSQRCYKNGVVVQDIWWVENYLKKCSTQEMQGMALAEFATQNQVWIRPLRSLTIGFLTPFYFIRARSFVSLTALLSALLIFIVLFIGKVGTKIFGLYPVIGLFRENYQRSGMTRL
jgi:Kef-type K+ transport system membrane component KefB